MTDVAGNSNTVLGGTGTTAVVGNGPGQHALLAQRAVADFNVWLRLGRQRRLPYFDHVTHVWHMPRLDPTYYEGQPRPKMLVEPLIAMGQAGAVSRAFKPTFKHPVTHVTAPSVVGTTCTSAVASGTAAASTSVASTTAAAATATDENDSVHVHSPHQDDPIASQTLNTTIPGSSASEPVLDVNEFFASSNESLPSWPSEIPRPSAKPSITNTRQTAHRHQQHQQIPNAPVSAAASKRQRVELSSDMTNLTPAPPEEDCCHICQGPELSDYQPGLTLVTCCSCGKQWHPGCLNWTPAMQEHVNVKTWQCVYCKGCSVCLDKVEEDKILFCDLCDLGYHLYCLKPPLDSIPEDEWMCPQCTNSRLLK